jgi:filamentous hemagglutinin family protein
MNQSPARRTPRPLPRARLARRALATALAAAFSHAPQAAWAQALPTGMNVVNGTATITPTGTPASSGIEIRNSPNAILNWQSFSIGQSNTVKFVQDNASSKVLNRVVGNDPSNILGSLTSNGQVWLVNPNGVMFGQNARVDVGALVASTLGISNTDFLAGRNAFVAGGVPDRQVLNQGTLSTSLGGHVWLVGGSVQNEGSVSSPGGQIVLAAGQSVDLVDSGVPNVTVRVSASGNDVVNLGQLLAPGGGSIDLHGAIVNQQGIVRATSLDNDKTGRILIRAQGDVTLGDDSETSAGAAAESDAAGGSVTVESVEGTNTVQGRVSALGRNRVGGQIRLLGRAVEVSSGADIDASGTTGGGQVLIGTAQETDGPAVRNADSVLVDYGTPIRANATDSGDGGSIVIRSDGTTQVYTGLEARSGIYGGKGGAVETSGAFVDARPSFIHVGAPEGDGGSWLLRADNVTVVDSTCLLCGGEARLPVQESVVLNSLVRDVLAQAGRVRVEAASKDAAPSTGNLKITADMDATEYAPLGAALTLAAQNDLTVNDGIRIGNMSNPMPVTLIADLEQNGTGALRLGAGTQVFTAGGGLTLGGNSTGNGTAQSISLAGSRLDAGGGTVIILGNEVDIRGDSAVSGEAILIAGGNLTMQHATLDASEGTKFVSINVGNATIGQSILSAGRYLEILAWQNLTLDGTTVSANGSGDALILKTGRLDADASRITAPNGRWLAYLDTASAFSPSLYDKLGYTFLQVGAGSTEAPVLSGPGQNGVIVRAPMDVRVQVDADRVYDGTTGAAFSTALGSDLAPAFMLHAQDGGVMQGQFTDKNAGTGKTIVLDGAAAPYAITTSTGQPVYGANQTYVADITPKSITGSLTGASKVYDGTRTTTVSGSLAGTIAGDDVRVDGAAGLFDTRDAGTGKAITLTGDPLSGADAGNYRLQVDSRPVADITPRPIALTGLTALDKVYDGTRAATLSGSLTEILEGDAVSVNGATGQFADKNAGTGKTVSISGATLAGTDAGNYALNGSSNLQASITPRAITLAGVTALDKVYDGTRAATLSGSLTEILEGDAVSVNGATGQFADKNAGTGKTVSISGATLAGTDAGNYALNGSSNVQASITPRAITLAGVTALDKVYDGTRAATLSGSLTDILAGDAVSLNGATGQFADKNAGAAKTVSIAGATLAGADAANYTVGGSATVQAAITPRPLTLTGVTALDKVYDGTRTASVSASIAGALPGDAVSLATFGQFDTKNVGAAKTVAVTGALGGADAMNYTVALPSSASAAVTARALEIVLSGEVRKEYDATLQASLAPDAFRLDGVVAGDTVTVRGPAQGSFATPDVGRNKPVSVSGAFDIGGADAANYRVGAAQLTSSTGAVQATATGNVGTITPATLVYQASPASGLGGLVIGSLGGTVTGFKGGDTLAGATSGTLQWDSAATPGSAPGTYAVYGSGLSAANYQFVQAAGNATALELKASLPANAPQQRAQDASAQAINVAVQAAVPVTVSVATAQAVSSAVFDRATVAPAKMFTAVRIESMNQDELGRLIAYRKDFKRKLFADAIYKLEIDPSLADVRPCNTAAEAASGTCRITPAQVAALQATAAQAAAPANGIAAAQGARARVVNLPRIERKIAVLFGINDYTDKDIPQLENAVPDADGMGKVFADKLGYEVRVVRNPDKATIVRTLNALAAEAGSADSVAIYYAGHGFSMNKNAPGYWLAADASVTDPKSWISNADIAHLLSGIRSKQVTLISDSCYSGAFAREGLGAIGQHVAADDVLAKRSVVVLSSGGDEPVPDAGKDGHSIFTWYLMQVIGSVTDWKQGSTIFSDVQARVRKEFPQTPTYGSLTAAGHQAGGDYLFESRSN